MGPMYQCNRQPLKKRYFLPSTVKNTDGHLSSQGIFILLFLSVSADRHGLLAHEASSSKLENQFPCSEKYSFSFIFILLISEIISK